MAGVQFAYPVGSGQLFGSLINAGRSDSQIPFRQFRRERFDSPAKLLAQSVRSTVRQ
jgi:hypothetical protein